MHNERCMSGSARGHVKPQLARVESRTCPTQPFLPTQIRGQFLRLYMMLDVYSRNIVGWEIHEDERSEYAARLMERACLKHKIQAKQLVLHSDNGSPMKGATMLATLQRLGVVPSFSRPSVSDDNPLYVAPEDMLSLPHRTHTPAMSASPMFAHIFLDDCLNSPKKFHQRRRVTLLWGWSMK